MNYYYVAPIYYIPVKYAADLVTLCNYSQDQAVKATIERYGYYGKKNSKRLKEFDSKVLANHLRKYLKHPNTILMRKSHNRS